LGFWILQQAASNLAASDLEVMENGEDDEMVMAKTERIVGDHGDGHEEIMMKKEFEELEYQNGFGNHCVTEALKGALPVKQNSPLKCPYGLYAEQISGTAFTVPRKLNQRRWVNSLFLYIYIFFQLIKIKSSSSLDCTTLFFFVFVSIF
jgi:hypothetical protein